eukprot:3709824-Rhodomonas_salina.3
MHARSPERARSEKQERREARKKVSGTCENHAAYWICSLLPCSHPSSCPPHSSPSSPSPRDSADGRKGGRVIKRGRGLGRSVSA